jgi:hypothetical protein
MITKSKIQVIRYAWIASVHLKMIGKIQISFLGYHMMRNHFVIASGPVEEFWDLRLNVQQRPARKLQLAVGFYGFKPVRREM